MNAALRLPGVVPDLPSCPCINGPDSVRNGEIHDAVHDKRSRLDYAGKGILRTVDAVQPGEAQRLDVRCVDLRKCAEAATRVIAVIRRPGINWRLKQLSGIESFRREYLECSRKRQCAREKERNTFHFKVSK